MGSIRHEHECTYGDALAGRAICPQSCTLYAIFDGEQPLYAGRSSNPPRRVCDHFAWLTGFGHHPERTATAAYGWIVRFYTPAACRSIVPVETLPSLDRALANGNWEWAMKLAEPFLIRHLRPALNTHYRVKDEDDE